MFYQFWLKKKLIASQSFQVVKRVCMLIMPSMKRLSNTGKCLCILRKNRSTVISVVPK